MALKDYYAGSVEFIVADFDIPETHRLLEMEDFAAPYIPMFYFINGQGEVVSGEAGVFSFEDMKKRIDLIVAE